MNLITKLVRAELEAQHKLNAAIHQLNKAQEAVAKARNRWMAANRAVIEARIRKDLKRVK